jgi:hypothetical protein
MTADALGSRSLYMVLSANVGVTGLSHTSETFFTI